MRYAKAIDSDNYKDIIKMYTREDVILKLYDLLRSSKRDIFFLSAKIISSKIINALMKV
jgi:hypothetical protein